MTGNGILGLRRLADARAALNRGQVSSEALTEAALAAIEAPDGEGRRTALSVYRTQALAAARGIDALRAAGVQLPPLAGLPISIKDLFDVAGEPTRAGSTILADAPPAAADAPAIANLRRLGAVIVAKTNMVEFAFSGVGINPHYGTPLNPWDRATGRVPGGSSSGAAVSVTDGMALAAIGTDTGGSVRIPSALCGLTGFKPTTGRHPMAGVLPLSTTVDTLGPLAWSVDCCRTIDAALRGEMPPPAQPLPAAGLRLAVPQAIVLDDLDDAVAGRFEQALLRLSAAGARIVELPFREVEGLSAITSRGGFSAAESWAWHRELIARGRDHYDPRVLFRIEGGAAITAADYIDMHRIRAELRAVVDRVTRPFDALVLPTTPIVAPPVAPLLANDQTFFRHNALLLRNTNIGNLLDRPAVSLPIGEPDGPPVGLMVMGGSGEDARILDVAEGIEQALALSF
ncbi:MAG: amidase [Pseudomonadota bacterium]|nr:amidase [Pseudomonadota bacterium]